MKAIQLRKSIRIIVLAAFLLAACFQFVVPAQNARADVSAGFAEYYVPGPTALIRPILLDNQTTISDSNIHNVITFPVTTAGLTVYYDQWENGYSSGAAGDEVYSGFAIGDVVTFESPSIPYNHTSSTVCSGSTNPSGSSNHCYDGRDRIFIVGGAVSMSQVFWPSSTGTVYANAWEIYPDNAWVSSYTMPVGENLFDSYNSTSNYADFDNVYVLIQAGTLGATVSMTNPGGTALPSTVLAQGAAVALYHVNSKAVVTSDNPVQVQWINGRQNGSYDSRGHTLVPSNLWDKQYYSPVPSYSSSFSTTRVNLYMYNPNLTSLAVTYQDTTGTVTCTIAAGATQSSRACTGRNVPADSAAYLSAASNFFAVGEYDTGDPNYNWGFSIIPSTSLRDEYYVAWAKGTTDLSNNGSPVFVTPTVNNQVIYADYSPTNGVANTSVTLNRLAVGKIRDSDNDNTGMHLWSASPFAIVWGEDDQYAGANNPYIDAGYTILPLIPGEVALELNKSANPSAIAKQAGETVQFTLVVDTGIEAVQDIYLTDLLPPYFQYVTGSTLLTLPGGSESAYSDPSSTGSDAAGWSLRWPATSGYITNMNANETLTLKFSAITVTGIADVVGDQFTDYADVYGTWNGILLNATSQAVVTAAVPGHIVVIKDAVADSLYPFEFNLWDQTKPYDKTQFFLKDHPTLPGQNTKSFGLLPGAYEVQETVPTGWYLHSATCGTDVVGKGQQTPDDIELEAGETVTCTFVNYDQPTAVEVAQPEIFSGAGFVKLLWETGSEVELQGFNIYRSDSVDSLKIPLNSLMISAKNQGDTHGASYEFIDSSVESGRTYFYWIQVIDQNGGYFVDGVLQATINYYVHLPIARR